MKKNINESITREEYINRVLNFMLEDTNFHYYKSLIGINYPMYPTETIFYPFEDIISMYNGQIWSIGSEDIKYMSSTYGITDKNEIDDLFQIYKFRLMESILPLIDEVWNGMDNLNESVERGNNLIDGVVSQILAETKYEFIFDHKGTLYCRVQFPSYPGNTYTENISEIEDFLYQVYTNNVTIGATDIKYLEHNYGINDLTTIEDIWEKYYTVLYTEIKDEYWEVWTNRNEGNSLNESVDGNYTYYDKISTIIKLPYIIDLKSLDIPEHLWGKILSKVFNQEISEIYVSRGSNGYSVVNSNGNKIYYEQSDGWWEKKEYDSRGNQIYYENSEGNLDKREYDSNGKLVYLKTSDGKIVVNGKIISRGTINESVERLDRLVDMIVNYLMEETKYRFGYDRNDEVVVHITFPSKTHGDELYSIREILAWSEEGIFYTDDTDLEYIDKHYGITDNLLIKRIYNIYIQKLTLMLYKKMEYLDINREES